VRRVAKLILVHDYSNNHKSGDSEPIHVCSP
jgi:hypothetical protein